MKRDVGNSISREGGRHRGQLSVARNLVWTIAAAASVYASVAMAQSEDRVKAGLTLWRTSGCGECHGAAGQGVGKTFPKLAGQSAEYIANQLKAWKAGKLADDLG